ncbi:MAG: hypothetical protein HOP15_07375, partial [Planctomycetes bacterium]|nr:hypothetical protein [Planctomycetota bacterium]
MRFSAGPAQDVEDLLGDFANRLEGRLERRALPPGPAGQRVQLVFARAALDADELALLAHEAELAPASADLVG